MVIKMMLSLMSLVLLLPFNSWGQTILPEETEDVWPAQSAAPAAVSPAAETTTVTPATSWPDTPQINVLFEEMTLVQVLSEEYARIEAACAGVGLNTVTPDPDGPRVIIPNAGDLSLDGANVAIKVHPDGEITFIPRYYGQRVRIPMDVAGLTTGQEVISLTMDQALQFMAADKLYWTARDKGPYGNGHGLPGHIAACDPRYVENQ